MYFYKFIQLCANLLWVRVVSILNFAKKGSIRKNAIFPICWYHNLYVYFLLKYQMSYEYDLKPRFCRSDFLWSLERVPDFRGSFWAWSRKCIVSFKQSKLWIIMDNVSVWSFTYRSTIIIVLTIDKWNGICRTRMLLLFFESLGIPCFKLCLILVYISFNVYE